MGMISQIIKILNSFSISKFAYRHLLTTFFSSHWCESRNRRSAANSRFELNSSSRARLRAFMSLAIRLLKVIRFISSPHQLLF